VWKFSLPTHQKKKKKKSQKCETSCCCNQRFGVQLHISFKKKIRKLSQILDVADSFSQIKLCLCFLNPRLDLELTKDFVCPLHGLYSFIESSFKVKLGFRAFPSLFKIVATRLDNRQLDLAPEDLLKGMSPRIWSALQTPCRNNLGFLLACGFR
jgi:hypothetical protein